MPSASIRATAAAIWSMMPCIRSRIRWASSSSISAGPPPGAGGVRGERPVAQPDELGALVGERREQRRDLDQGVVGGVDVEERGHRRGDSSPTCARGPGPCGASRSRTIDVASGGSADTDGPGSRRRAGADRRRVGRARRRHRAPRWPAKARGSRSPPDRRIGSTRRRRAWPAPSPSASTSSTPGRPGAARSTGAVAAFGGLDLLLVNSGGPPPGTFEELDEAAWQRAIDGTLRSALRAHPRRAAAPSRERPTGDPRHPVVVGARADPRPDDVQHAAARARRAWSSR